MPPKEKRKLRRRVLNKEQSLKAYEARMRALPEETIMELDGKYLSSLDVFDTYNIDDPEIDRRYESFLDNSCFRLAHVCKARNIKILGVTSTRIMQGQRIAAVLPEYIDKIKYVGGHCGCSFHNLRSSVFSLRPEDKRYEPPSKENEKT